MFWHPLEGAQLHHEVTAAPQWLMDFKLTFKKLLKTHSFKQAFDCPCTDWCFNYSTVCFFYGLISFLMFYAFLSWFFFPCEALCGSILWKVPCWIGFTYTYSASLISKFVWPLGSKSSSKISGLKGLKKKKKHQFPTRRGGERLRLLCFSMGWVWGVIMVCFSQSYIPPCFNVWSDASIRMNSSKMLNCAI